MTDPDRKAEPAEEDVVDRDRNDPILPNAGQRESTFLDPRDGGDVQEEPANERPFQFSLAGLLVFITIVAVWCSLMSWLPVGWFFGVYPAVLICIIILQEAGATRRVINLVGWIGVGFYLVTAIAGLTAAIIWRW